MFTTCAAFLYVLPLVCFLYCTLQIACLVSTSSRRCNFLHLCKLAKLICIVRVYLKATWEANTHHLLHVTRQATCKAQYVNLCCSNGCPVSDFGMFLSRHWLLYWHFASRSRGKYSTLVWLIQHTCTLYRKYCTLRHFNFIWLQTIKHVWIKLPTLNITITVFTRGILGVIWSLRKFMNIQALMCDTTMRLLTWVNSLSN